MAIGHKVRGGIGKQSAWGTPATTLTGIKLESYGAFDLNIEQIESSEMFGTIDKWDTINGNESTQGSIAGRVYPGVIGHVITSALGVPTTSGSSDYVHTFTPSDMPPVYTLGFAEDHDAAFSVSDARCTSFKLTQDLSQPLKFSADYIAAIKTYESVTVPSTVESTPLTFKQFSADINSVETATLRGLNITVQNPIENVFQLDGTVNPVTQEYTGMRSVTLDGTLRFTSLADSMAALFSGGTYVPMEFTWEADANTSLVVTLPRVKLVSHGISKGAGIVEVSFSAEAFTDGTKSIEIVLSNSVDSY